MASFITEKIEEAYEIPLKVEAIRISRLNEIELKGISLLDQQGYSIISAGRATAHISPLKIFKNEIQVNTLTLAEPDARIYRESKDSAMNIQFILDKFKSNEEKEKKELGIRINQLLLYDGKFRYDINDAPCKEDSLLDPAHISIDDIRCNITLKELRNENFNLRIRSVRGREKSGLELQTVKARILADSCGISLKNLELRLPGSNITSDSIIIAYDKDNTNALKIDGEIKSSKISPNDIQPLSSTDLSSIPAFAFRIKGHSDSISAKADIKCTALDNSMTVDVSTNIAAPYSTERVARVKIAQLDAEKSIANALSPFIRENGIKTICKLDFCKIKGDAELTTLSANGNITANTGCGDIELQFNIDRQGEYTAEIKGWKIDIAKIAGIKEQAVSDMRTNLQGNVKKIKDLTAKGEITGLNLREHGFAPITFCGAINKGAFSAEAVINDSIIKAGIKAGYATDEKKMKKGSLALYVSSFMPGQLSLRENKDEILSFDIIGDLSILPDNRHMANAQLKQFTFHDGEKTHKLNNLHFSDNTTGEERLMMINSDFLNCSVIGEFDLAGMIQSMQDIAEKHLPALYTSHSAKKDKGNRCNYIYKLDIKQSDILTAFFKLPASIKEHSTVYGVCNDEKGIFTLNTKLNNTVFNKTVFKSISINSYSNNDKLELNADIVKAAKNKPNSTEKKNDLELTVRCAVADNRIDNAINWSNNARKRKQEGNISFNAELGRDKDGLLTIKTKIDQDSIINNDSIWYISGGSVTGNQEELYIKSMFLYNNDQYLKIDGTAGKSNSDSLHINAKNLDVTTIMNLVNFKILQFGGKATGTGYITNLLSGPDVTGTFDVENLAIDNCRMGQGLLNIGWENSSKSILLDCDISNDNNIVSNVSGFLSPAQDTIHLAIDANDLNAGFVNRMLKSVMSDIDGVGNGKAWVLGSWRKVNLIGAVELNCSARIKPTNVTYYINGDSLHFYKGLLTFNNVHAKDRRGNSGWLDGKVTHDNMTNWACDINVRAENLLAYDTNNFDSAPFYGTVYATGNANILASSDGLFLKVEAKSEPNTRFVYNASQTGSVRDNSFVKFIDSSKKVIYTDFDDEEEETKEEKNVNSKMNLDFMLDVNEDAMIKVYTNLKNDDYLELYGKGPINAVYDEKEGFSMKGNVDVDRGTYKITVQDIFTKEFYINKGGTLSFNGDPAEVALNIRAKHLVPSASLSDLTTETSKRKTVKVNCLMDITGTLKSPNLNFDLELPDANEEERELLASVTTTPEQKSMQFIYLLGIGKFYTYDYNMQAGGSQSSTAVESLISNTLSGQLNNMLGQIINNGNWNISGNFSTSERGWNSMEIEGMLEGRLLNNRLLINSNFGYRENPIANSNFIGDFELQWLLNKTGTVSLKAYSKTNDRYFSKTNLTTQGAGITFRHDFNKWFWWRSKREKKVEKQQ